MLNLAIKSLHSNSNRIKFKALNVLLEEIRLVEFQVDESYSKRYIYIEK